MANQASSFPSSHGKRVFSAIRVRRCCAALSLTCSAIAGRHLLQLKGTLKSFKAYSKLYTPNYVLGGMATLTAEIAATTQSTYLEISVRGVPTESTPTFTNPAYYYTASGEQVAEFPCTFQRDAKSGNYLCTATENAALTTAYEPVGNVKKLIDAKVLTEPKALFFSFKVDDVLVTANILVAPKWYY
ncbi:unnamed protein product [Closterium sp. Yama58-4]|nr:unnamed protein product [Closterium sp. Yama58-4]